MNDLLIFCPSIEKGGVEKNLFIITNYLSTKINSIYLLTANTDSKNKFNSDVKLISPKKNIYNNASRFKKSLICLFLFLKFFTRKEIVILSFQSNILAIFLSKIFKKKIIIRANTSPKKFAKGFIRKFFFKFFFGLADKIIVNSLDFQNQMKYFLGVKSICIYNSIKIEKIKKKKIKFFSKNCLNIINVARLVNQKDHLTLLKAFKLLVKKIRAKLLIVGKGNGKQKLIKYIKNNGLNKTVKLYGYSNNPFGLMKSSNLFVLSSIYEGLPNVLIEAQQINLPIISSDCPTGPREILLSGKLGELYQPGNFNELYLKILAFSKNKKKLLKKSLLAKKYIYRFNLIKNCNKYFEIIDSLR